MINDDTIKIIGVHLHLEYYQSWDWKIRSRSLLFINFLLPLVTYGYASFTFNL